MVQLLEREGGGSSLDAAPWERGRGRVPLPLVASSVHLQKSLSGPRPPGRRIWIRVED